MKMVSLRWMGFIFLCIFTASIVSCKKSGQTEKLAATEPKILTHGPHGKNLPISTEGITVMFDQPMIPLTVLDEQEKYKVDLTIDPPVEGKIHWLGTTGFTFKPFKPLLPSTTYKVKLGKGIKSIRGGSTRQDTEWQFSTVAPKVVSATHGVLHPKFASLDVHFNVAMDTKQVEEKLSFVHVGSKVPVDLAPQFLWLENNHLLRMTFKKELPWGASLTLNLPAGLKGQIGDLGTEEVFKQNNKVYEKTFFIENFRSGYSYNLKTAPDVKQNEVLSMNTRLCYGFSQPLTGESLKKAIQVTNVQGQPQAINVYGTQSLDLSYVDQSGKKQRVDGFYEGCFTLPDEYGQSYTVSIKPHLLEAISGATHDASKTKAELLSYSLKTTDAEPALSFRLKGHVISAQNPPQFPIEAINVQEVLFRLYALNNEYFTEIVTNNSLQPANHYDKQTKKSVRIEPPVSNITGTWQSVPLDETGAAIDQTKMPATWVYSKKLDYQPNKEIFSSLKLSDIAGQNLKPGLYLLESLPRSETHGKVAPRVTVFQVTSIALSIKKEIDHFMVWATDIETARPVGNLDLLLTSTGNYTGKVFTYEGKTDENGVLIVDRRSNKNWKNEEDGSEKTCVEVVDALKNSVSCDNHHYMYELSTYDQMKRSKHHFAYVYTDRPVYRPGQKVYFSSFVRRVREGYHFMPSKDATASVVVNDSAGNEIYAEKNIKISDSGIISGTVELSSDDNVPRGTYTISLEVDGQFFTKAFSVTSYKKPSFKVALSADKDLIASREKAKLNLEGKYFFGAPMSKAKSVWSIMATTYLFSPKNYDGYQFVDEDFVLKNEEEYVTNYEYEELSIEHDEESSHNLSNSSDTGGRGPGNLLMNEKNKYEKRKYISLDQNGAAIFEYTPDLIKYPISQTLTFEASITDSTQQEVATSKEVVVHKGQFYWGLQPEKYLYAPGTEALVKLVSVDIHGQPTAHQNYTASLYKREHQMVERESSPGNWESVYEEKDTLIKKLSGQTDAEGLADLKYTVPSAGNFRVVVTGEDSAGNSIRSADEFYSWSETGEYVPWKVSSYKKLELVTDKSSYKVGETARVLVKSLMPLTKALVTFERGRVLDYRLVELGGNAGHIEVPITEGMVPNIYVSVLAPVSRDGKRHPQLFAGQAQLVVDPEKRLLKVDLQTDKQGDHDKPAIYRPGEEVTVKVKTTKPSGQAQKAHVIVSVADESVLKLLNYQKPDLLKTFFYSRKNNVNTSSSLTSLKAGDGGQGSSDVRKRRIFKDTAHFEAHLTTDEKGEASFKFTLPDDLTTWVVEAVAISDSYSFDEYEKSLESSSISQKKFQSNLSFVDNTYVGSERTRLISTLPVLVRPGLPRFAAWGDTFEAKVVLNNKNDEPVSGQLEVLTDEAALFVDKNQRQQTFSFDIPPQSEKTFSIPVKVQEGHSRMKFEATAKNSAGVGLDSFEVNVKLLDRYVPEVTSTSGMIKDQQLEQIDLPDFIHKSKGEFKYTFKASMGVAVAGLLRELIYYPYGCSEQRSSSLAGLLLAKNFIDRFGMDYLDVVMPSQVDEETGKKLSTAQKYELMEKNIKQTIQDLYLFSNEQDGGMKYWTTSSYSNDVFSGQILWVLSMARGMGFEVDSQIYDSLSLYLNNLLRSPTYPYTAYLAWTLSLSGQTPAPEVLVNLMKKPDALASDTVSYLLMAYAPTLTPQQKDILIKQLESSALLEPRHVRWRAAGGDSSLKNTSLALQALLKIKPDHPYIPRGMAYLFNRKRSGHLPLTQDNLFVSLLAKEYSVLMSEENTDFEASLTLGQTQQKAVRFDKSSLLKIFSAEVSMAELSKQIFPLDVTVAKTHDKDKENGVLYYDYELKYYLPTDKQPPREQGLIVHRNYYALDDTREERPLDQFVAGQNYKGVITLVLPKSMSYILIEDPLAAGFEPIDMTLSTSSRAAALEASTIDEDEEETATEEFQPRHFHADHVLPQADYGMTYDFSHQQIRDDAILWSSEHVDEGTYQIRYPIRAVTSGNFIMVGAQAFEFYEAEVFGRSRTKNIVIQPAAP